MYGIPVLYPDIAHANVQDSRLYQITFGYIAGTLCICMSIQTDVESTVNLALLYCGSLASAGDHGVGIEFISTPAVASDLLYMARVPRAR